MSPTQRKSALVAALILISCTGFAGWAHADIVECVDETGAVTFTDLPCKSDADAKRGAVKFGKEPEKISSAADPQKSAAGQKVGAAKSEIRPPPNSGLDTDVATLKAAKASLLMMDRISTITRRQALASRD